MINRKLTNVHAMSVLPTFTRASTAYKEDGTSVAADVPRFDNGLIIEEPTTNLLEASDSQLLSSAVSVVVVSGSVYSVSCKTGTITLSGAGSGTVTPTSPITITASTTALTLTPAPSATYAQVELKNYSTGWQLGKITRTPQETLTIPASVLDYREGTIEFDYTPINQPLNTMVSASTDPVIIQIGDYYGQNSITLWRRPYNGIDDMMTLYIKGSTNSGWSIATSRIKTLVLNTRVRFGIRWKTANILDLFVGGTLLFSNITVADALTTMGNIIFGNISGSGGVNALFSNVRVSNKARSDTELAYTGDLSVDYYTTYLLPCKTSLVPKNF